MLRKDEDTLSVNWLEYLHCPNRNCEIAELRKIYSAKLNIGTKAKIAILNVGEVRNKVLNDSEDQRNIDVLHDPEENDHSHSGIYNLKQDNELIAELILEVKIEEYSARS
ncbi:MAG: hypothetical protein V3U54_10595, partial [Thermodesulfobacteriota bacterium]